ncbi:hypothetical protein MP228_009221 [Amoeboaphelidium protococcarum]|nr:hypothetical protein MP228_009221 [Amoeboaphelidium protococcarum]
MATTFNKSNASIKRILKEWQVMQKDLAPEYEAHPVGDDNLFEWHFTIKGPENSAFQDGIYHGRIILPPDYPFKPPHIIMLTPNGRFEVGKKICLSITGYHPESWSAAWDVRTALVALRSFFPQPSEGAVGGLDWTDDERLRLAKESVMWTCNHCQRSNRDIIKRIVQQSNDVHESVDSGSDASQQNLSSPLSQRKDEESAIRQRLQSSVNQSSPVATAPVVNRPVQIPQPARQSSMIDFMLAIVLSLLFYMVMKKVSNLI